MSTIKHKGALDAKRGKLFTKLSKEIIVAAREGSDPEMNLDLDRYQMQSFQYAK